MSWSPSQNISCELRKAQRGWYRRSQPIASQPMVIPIDLLQTTQLFILPPVELVVAVLDDELEELEDIFVELFVELFVGSVAVWLLVVV